MASDNPPTTDSQSPAPSRDPASVSAREGDAWYTDAADYWAKVPGGNSLLLPVLYPLVHPTVEGMLGGFGKLTDTDCASSLKFIEEFVDGKRTSAPRIGTGLACDCGAGIGRVSKHFLLHKFARVDLVEQNPAFLKQAEKEFGELGLGERVEKYIPVGLQSFVPEKIRVHYPIFHGNSPFYPLLQDDVVSFLKRCKTAIGTKGLIGIKENVTKVGADVDKEDSSVTRSDEILRGLFEKAGLKVLKRNQQTGFPRGLYGVFMYAFWALPVRSFSE
ncbi:hypothetical protein HDV00_007502 [Rhizophlyctis rosea]|nr:hypothetical protein HDV00_007502 [Rhizophlyctis rosea]